MIEVIEFIKRRFPTDCKWKDGNCYYFSVILKNRFPQGDIYYDIIYGHFVFKLNDTYYDWDGMVDMSHRAVVKWEEFDKYDSLVKERIIRDCIK